MWSDLDAGRIETYPTFLQLEAEKMQKRVMLRTGGGRDVARHLCDPLEFTSAFEVGSYRQEQIRRHLKCLTRGPSLCRSAMAPASHRSLTP